MYFNIYIKYTNLVCSIRECYYLKNNIVNITYKMSKEKYHCDICNYSTDTLFCYKKHMITKKHSDKKIEADKQIPVNNVFVSIHKCMHCQKICQSSSSLSKHQKTCSERNIMIAKIESLEKEIRYRDNMIHDRDKMIDEKERSLREALKTLEYERVKEKDHLSASSYLNSTYNTASNLDTLTDFSMFNDENNDPIDILISAQRNNNLDEYIGNALVSHYKTPNPRDQKLWNCDVQGLTYFIRKKLSWTIDKKGVKTGALIVAPILYHFNEILKEIVTMDVLPQKTSVNEILVDNERRKLCSQIMEDIETGTLLNKVLKYIAPYMYLDKQIKYIKASPVLKKIKNT